MSAYSTGSVKVKVGSALVYGNNTNFTTYAAAGNIFKIAGENVTYIVAAINTATRLTLSSRYANSNEQTARSENVASCGASTRSYSGTLTNKPVIQNYVVLTASARYVDNGGGVLAGSDGGSGTIDYDTGAYSITLAATLNATYNVAASYYSGNTLNTMSYQIIRDYTSNFKYPESVPSDKNLAYIFTKAVRMIDEDINNASMTSASITNLKVKGKDQRKIISVSATYAATAANNTIIVGGTNKKKITLPHASAKNKGLLISITRNLASDVIATVAAAAEKVNASQSITIKTRYRTDRFLCATTNLWIKI